MIDLSKRLRRAIHLNDVLLCRRMIDANPSSIQNPDYADSSNTSLHLAAKLGHVDLVRLLIDAGHEDSGISLNTEFETPLMLACEAKQIETGLLLINIYPRCIPYINKNGMDALMLASRNGTLPLISPLLTATTPASITAHDKDGNTALHYASASGELKALRLLLQYGASPLAQNAYSWTPIAYSATTAAEAYFKQLVAEIERRRVEAVKDLREKEKARQAGVRLVTSSEEIGGRRASVRPRLESFSTLDEAGPPRVEWSPVERMAMTPTEGKAGGFYFGNISSRRRAGSGD
ncbi:ankyrin [Microthyrium microscopicum]|uniref:Ankyrin n=1 Tax=Microthyrium microscopicum TaxID=703497 RepID=A0A6A6UHY2_9PEZI|nr:ankyrin [Microthyrium microscopicum]